MALAQGAQAATFLFFPALFLAPTFVPREALRGWLSTASAYNPTTYVIEAMRAIMVEGWINDVIFKGYLAAGTFAILTLSFAVVSARRATEKASKKTIVITSCKTKTGIATIRSAL